MTAPMDPRDLLRAANPVAADEVPSAHAPEAVAMFERIVSTLSKEAPAPRRKWLRRGAWILIPVAAAGAAAAGYGLFRNATDPIDVVCFAEAKVTPGGSLVPNVPEGPEAACAPLWSSGDLINPDGSGSVPQLVACVLDTGAIGVFPDTLGSDTCGELSLPRYVGGGPDSDDAILVRLQNELTRKFTGRCFGDVEAVDVVKRQLEELGLSEWTIELGEDLSAARPCRTLAFDSPNKTVILQYGGDPNRSSVTNGPSPATP
jgi:hypothetical protein